jgi:hypothetical protein
MNEGPNQWEAQRENYRPVRITEANVVVTQEQWWAAILKNVSFKAIQIHNF